MLDPFSQGEYNFEQFLDLAVDCQRLARDVRDFSNVSLKEILQVVVTIQERVIDLAKIFRDAHPRGAADIFGVVCFNTALLVSFTPHAALTLPMQRVNRQKNESLCTAPLQGNFNYKWRLPKTMKSALCIMLQIAALRQQVLDLDARKTRLLVAKMFAFNPDLPAELTLNDIRAFCRSIMFEVSHEQVRSAWCCLFRIPLSVCR
jgi:hypothetical protein